MLITIKTKSGELIERNAKEIGNEIVVGNTKYKLVPNTIGLFVSNGRFKKMRVVGKEELK